MTKIPLLENEVLEQNFKNLILPTLIFRYNKPKRKFWCHSDTGWKSGSINLNRGTDGYEQQNHKFLDQNQMCELF